MVLLEIDSKIAMKVENENENFDERSYLAQILKLDQRSPKIRVFLVSKEKGKDRVLHSVH